MSLGATYKKSQDRLRKTLGPSLATWNDTAYDAIVDVEGAADAFNAIGIGFNASEADLRVVQLGAAATPKEGDTIQLSSEPTLTFQIARVTHDVVGGVVHTVSCYCYRLQQPDSATAIASGPNAGKRKDYTMPANPIQPGD